MIRNDRAQAIGNLRVFLSLGVGAVVYWILSLVTDPLLSRAQTEAAAGTAATDGTLYLQQGIRFFPLVVALIVFFGHIAYTVYTREVLQ